MASLGVDAIGVNRVSGTPRVVGVKTLGEIARAIGSQVEVIAVVADASTDELLRLRESTGVDWLQLHGSESESQLRRLLPQAFKAVRVATSLDVEQARGYTGERILVDAKHPGALGGTGRGWDWTLARGLAEARRVILAGGLTPENVETAIMRCRPWGVDVASGVEVTGNPRSKDLARARRFVERARLAGDSL